MSKEQLRLAARIALERRYGSASPLKSQGVVPGARLAYEEEGKGREAAVRTSTGGAVGLLKDAEGNWRTLKRVHLVLVATRNQKDRKLVQIYAFDPKVIKAEFDRAVEMSGKSNSDEKWFRTPVFLPLFEKGKGLAKKKGLSALRLWIEEVKIADLPTSAAPPSSEQALDTLRTNIAKGLGVHPNRIALSFSFHLKDDSRENSDAR